MLYFSDRGATTNRHTTAVALIFAFSTAAGCEGSDEGEPAEHKEPLCSVETQDDQSKLITCDDGTTAIVRDGERGPQGEPGPQGPPGPEGPRGEQGESGVVSGQGGSGGLAGSAGVGGSGGSGARPSVYCSGGWEAFPKAMGVSAYSSGPTTTEPIETLRWTLRAKPPNSAATETGPDSFAFDFVPDAPGDYTWCISGSTASFQLNESCGVYTSLTAFQWRFASDSATRSIDDVEIACGEITFAIEGNQPFESDLLQVTSSRPSVRMTPRGSTVGVTEHSYDFSLRYADAGMISYGGITAGDMLTAEVTATPQYAGQASTTSGHIVLAQTTPPTSSSAPVITDIRSYLYAGYGGTVGVRFASPPSEAAYLEIGGWAFFRTEQVRVADEGNNGDAMPHDGWYTGTLGSSSLNVAYIGECEACTPWISYRPPDPGMSYPVLLRARIYTANETMVGPFYRASFHWK